MAKRGWRNDRHPACGRNNRRNRLNSGTPHATLATVSLDRNQDRAASQRAAGPGRDRQRAAAPLPIPQPPPNFALTYGPISTPCPTTCRHGRSPLSLAGKPLTQPTAAAPRKPPRFVRLGSRCHGLGSRPFGADPTRDGRTETPPTCHTGLGKQSAADDSDA